MVAFKDLLIARYSKENENLEPEIKNIKLLKQIMDDYVRGKVVTIKIVLLKEISKEIGTITEKYKTSIFGN